MIRTQMAGGFSKAVRSHRKRVHARRLGKALRERGLPKAEVDRLVFDDPAGPGHLVLYERPPAA